MKTVIKIILTCVIALLIILLVMSIRKPIKFNKEMNKRYAVTIKRLKDIRTIQEAFKSKYDRYTASWDTLVDFIKHDSLEIEKPDRHIPDTLDLKEAIKLDLVKMIVTRIAVKDTLFKKRYSADSIRYVPFTAGVEFELGTNVLETAAKIKVNVFEASVKNEVLLDGLDPQLIANLDDQKETLTGFPGLKVGSLEEANNNAGNWE